VREVRVCAEEGGEMIDFMSPTASDEIRVALKKADALGQLGVIAAVVGIAGGEKELRKLMNSEGEMHIMDRGMIGVHLA
jgi:hypothetical protein